MKRKRPSAIAQPIANPRYAIGTRVIIDPHHVLWSWHTGCVKATPTTHQPQYIIRADDEFDLLAMEHELTAV